MSKKILFSLLIAVALMSALGITLGAFKQRGIPVVSNGSTVLSPRTNAMQRYLADGIADQTTTYEGKQYSLVLYRSSEGVLGDDNHEVQNYTDFPQKSLIEKREVMACFKSKLVMSEKNLRMD